MYVREKTRAFEASNPILLGLPFMQSNISLTSNEKSSMMGKIDQNTALIIIDVQKGFDEPVWGERNNPQAEENIGRLLEAWCKHGRPVLHVQHMSLSPTSPLNPNHPGNAIKDALQPLAGEPLIQKNVNSAFIGTELE